MKNIIKKKDTPCGTACLEYILFGHELTIPNMFWIVELAAFLYNETDYSIQLLYHKSSFMDSYFNRVADPQMMHLLDQYYEYVGAIEEKKVTKELLIQLATSHHYIILNVDSGILFSDPSLSGHNHFVIIESCDYLNTRVISPGKESFSIYSFNTETILKMISDNGQWILLLDE